MSSLSKSDIQNVLIGATMFASGGGGPLDLALQLLDKYSVYSQVRLITIEEAEQNFSDANVTVLACMGSPESVTADIDYKEMLQNAINYLQEKNDPGGYKIVMPVEYGGFNTFVPIIYGLKGGFTGVLDADCSGRAVPGLDTTFISLKGESITPLALANQDTAVFVDEITYGGADKMRCVEGVCRGICSNEPFHSIAALAAWQTPAARLRDVTIPGSITAAKNLGLLLHTYKNMLPDVDVFTYLSKSITGHQMKCLACNVGGASSVIEEIGDLTHSSGGFDTSYITVLSTDSQGKKVHFRLDYINETIVVRKENEVYMTAPDIICLYDDVAKEPLTNGHVHKNKMSFLGKAVSLGIISVDEKWNTISNLDSVWSPYFNAVGYQGGCVRFHL